MEKLPTLLVQALLGFLLFKILLKSLKWGLRLTLNAGAGLLGLTLMNTIPSVAIPINAVTILISGLLGIPGIGLLVLLERLL